MARNYSYFLKDILPSVPGCPDIRVEREIVRACIDFFRRSDVWEIDLIGGQNPSGTSSRFVTLTNGVPSNTLLTKVTGLKYDDRPLIPKTEDQIAEMYPEYTADLPATLPTYYSLIDESVLIVLPVPVGAVNHSIFRGRGIVVPTDSNDELPDKLYYQYEEVIVARVLGKLMIMPQQDWTNAKIGAAHGAFYEGKLDEVRKERKRRNAATRTTKSGDGYGGLLTNG